MIFRVNYDDSIPNDSAALPAMSVIKAETLSVHELFQRL